MVHYVAKNIPLSNLSLQGCQHLTDQAMEHLSHCAGLKQLKLYAV
jgi:hypothetical protein